MNFYRKKPVVIEAWQWNGETNKHWPQWMRDYKDTNYGTCYYHNGKLSIPTREGTIFAAEGDYIIKGIKGEIYPCKPDIFDATYEKLVAGE